MMHFNARKDNRGPQFSGASEPLLLAASHELYTWYLEHDEVAVLPRHHDS